MKMSEQGRNALIAREGCVLHAYRDSVGVWTIGVGHTNNAGPPEVKPGMKITQTQAEEILARDLVKYEKLVNDALKVPVAQHEFDALVSITFNVEAFARNPSTAIKRLNAGDRQGAASAIMLWNIPEEIIGRRKSEQRQFMTPYKSTPAKKAAEPPAPSAQPAPAKASWLEAIFSAVLSAFRKRK